MIEISKLYDSDKIRIITCKNEENNILFEKIMKYNFEDSLKDEFLMYEYLRNKNNILFENFSNYYEINIDKHDKINLVIPYIDKNIDIEFDFTDLFEAFLDDYEDVSEIKKIYIIITDYDKTKLTYYYYFKKTKKFDINLINEILLKLNQLHDLNFIHGDCHLSNILIKL